jgi:hypothetical protein
MTPASELPSTVHGEESNVCVGYGHMLCVPETSNLESTEWYMSSSLKFLVSNFDDLRTRQGQTCQRESWNSWSEPWPSSQVWVDFSCAVPLEESDVCVGQECLGSFGEKRYMRMLNLHTQKVRTGTHVVDPHILSASFSLKSTLKALGNDRRPLCGQPLCADEWASTNLTSTTPGMHR